MNPFSFYPAFINLNGKDCIVVGGGRIAERKVLTLIKCGARVKVISPSLTNRLEKLKKKGKIDHIERTYKKGDLKKAFLVIAATSDEDINRDVSINSPCLVNVVDMPEMANFIVPSVVDRNPLIIAISTSGTSPALAKAIRRELETFYNKNFSKYLVFLRKIRNKVIAEIHDKKERERFLKHIGSAEMINVIRKKGVAKAKEMVLKRFNLIKHKGEDQC